MDLRESQIKAHLIWHWQNIAQRKTQQEPHKWFQTSSISTYSSVDVSNMLPSLSDTIRVDLTAVVRGVNHQGAHSASILPFTYLSTAIYCSGFIAGTVARGSVCDQRCPWPLYKCTSHLEMVLKLYIVLYPQVKTNSKILFWNTPWPTAQICVSFIWCFLKIIYSRLCFIGKLWAFGASQHMSDSSWNKSTAISHRSD